MYFDMNVPVEGGAQPVYLQGVLEALKLCTSFIFELVGPWHYMLWLHCCVCGVLSVGYGSVALNHKVEGSVQASQVCNDASEHLRVVFFLSFVLHCLPAISDM